MTGTTEAETTEETATVAAEPGGSGATEEGEDKEDGASRIMTTEVHVQRRMTTIGEAVVGEAHRDENLVDFFYSINFVFLSSSLPPF